MMTSWVANARKLCLAVALSVLATACAQPDAWEGPTGEVQIPQAPIARATDEILVVDVDQDGAEPIALSAAASEDPDGEIVEYSWSSGLEEIGDGPEYATELPIGVHVFMLTVVDDDDLTDFLPIVVRVVPLYTTEPGAPEIVIWGGQEVSFDLGSSQRWLNIVGNVSDEDGVTSLQYQLNDGPVLPASLGPNERRLVRPGDFNIDLPRAAFRVGRNVVLIEATDSNGLETSAAIVVETLDQPAPELPVRVDWNELLGEAPALVDFVDGYWEFDDEATVPFEEAGYDRLLSLGSDEWSEYDVEVTVAVDDVRPQSAVGPWSASPAFGVMLRWQGHNNGITPGSQPRQGVYAGLADEPTPFGGFFLARWQPESRRFIPQLQNHRGLAVDFASGDDFEITDRFTVRFQVQSIVGGSLYRAKIWPAGTPEPSEWGLEHIAGDTDFEPSKGTVLLIAHELSASFGDVTVSPIAAADRVDATIEDLTSE